MKRKTAMRAFAVVLFPLLAAGCLTVEPVYFRGKHLDAGTVADAKTALVIDTEFFHLQEPTDNAFNMKYDDLSKAERADVIARLNRAEAAERPRLLADLAGLVRDSLTQKWLPSMGLDAKRHFDSRDFPVKNQEDLLSYSGITRDFQELAAQGYTHVLWMGFPNRIIYKDGAPAALCFGLQALLFDLRTDETVTEKKTDQAARKLWHLAIKPSLQESSDQYTRLEQTGFGYAYVTHKTTTYYRECLGITLAHRDNSLYSPDELFAGPQGAYFRLYRRAAVYGLGFVARHLTGENIYDEEYKQSVRAEDFLSYAPVRVSPFSLMKHVRSVSALAFSPDGRLLASGSWNNDIRLWDPATAERLTAEMGHMNMIAGLAFSPDGRTLASSSNDKTAKLWDVPSRKLIATLTGHTSTLAWIAWSPDGRTIATASTDKTVKLWDFPGGKEKATLSGHKAWIRSVSFSPDGRTLASADLGGSVILWDVGTGKQTVVITEGKTTMALFSPDGRSLALTGKDPGVRIVDVAKGKVGTTWDGPPANVAAWSPDGRRLAAGYDNGAVIVWDASTGKPFAILEGHFDWVGALAWSPDGKTLASAGGDTYIRLWDATKGFTMKQ